eukprot:TRINITY_DN4649_c0_g3_i1.p1 TRINITY_DN4649_c0_g3~~TRINITY_DN4649_c0_g3_i1.p1  ORF type:complete len:472 (-),score=77.60 TRINITY_DN4649_c0_g3_i1:127-1542(-)
MGDHSNRSRSPVQERTRSAEKDRLEALLNWLRSQGSDIEGIDIRSDGHGGFGAFATKRVPKGGTIASIPKGVVLSLSAAQASELGVAAAAAGATEDMTMWMYMAHGLQDSSHPWHTYLNSLPSVQPDPTAWADDTLVALQGTPLLKMVAEARAMVERELNGVRAKAAQLRPDPMASIIEAMTLERVLWARGVQLSRCFPAELASTREACVRPDRVETKAHEASSVTDGKTSSPEVGCMLPFFDLLNHKSGHPVLWRSSSTSVVFEAVEAIEVGDEVFNNYGGSKSNEQLLFFYGFAEADPELSHDIVSGLTLMCDFDVTDEAGQALLAEKQRRLLAEHIASGLLGGGTLRLGPFELGPIVQGQKLIPEKWLRALAIIAIESLDATPQLSLDMLDMLQQALAGNLLEALRAPAPPEEPRGRAASIRAYCDGRRIVLEKALAEVEAMIQAAEAELEAEQNAGEGVAEENATSS